MNISKKSARILALVLVITSGFFAYALLNPNNPMQMGAMDHGSSHSSTAAQTLSADDAMFLQMMIPHHAQAVVIAEYALTNSKNEQVLKIAKQIKSDQAGEITQMKKWLTDDGLGTDAGHSMAGMSGMLNDSQLNTLKSSKGGGFDKLFLNNMIEEEVLIGDKKGIIPSVAGQAWITGKHIHTLDPTDPWPLGYKLSDTWPNKL